jgi:hypothetical protein
MTTDHLFPDDIVIALNRAIWLLSGVPVPVRRAAAALMRMPDALCLLIAARDRISSIESATGTLHGAVDQAKRGEAVWKAACDAAIVERDDASRGQLMAVEMLSKAWRRVADLQREMAQRGSGGASGTQSLTEDDLVAACRNIGFDLTCGACAGEFYSGYDDVPPGFWSAARQALAALLPLPAEPPEPDDADGGP